MSGEQRSGQSGVEETGCREHPYLAAKGISLDELKSASPGRIEIREDSVKTDSGPYTGEFIFRDLVDISGAHKGCERILPEKIRKDADSGSNDKFAQAGSKVKGTFTPIGFDPSQLIEMDQRVIVCAGLADGYRIYEATGEPVACGVGENNVSSIASAIAVLNPDVLVAVDSDDTGIKAGEESGFCWTHPDDAKDWSDLFWQRGREAIVEDIDKINPPGSVDNEESGQKNSTSPGGFRLIKVGDMELRPPSFLIRDLLETNCLGLVFGAPECGKSLLVLDLACSIVTGNDYHGKPVKEAGPVIYVLGEGHSGIKRRLRAWEIRHGVDLSHSPLFVSQIPAALCDASQAAAVADAVDEIAAQYGPPALIVVDTLARNFGPGDENSTQDMNMFVQTADMLRSQHQSAVLIVHHTGHADKQRARGAMALKAAMDVEYRVTRDDTGTARVETTKMKDAPKPPPMAFKLTTVELGIKDDEGREVTSTILEHVDYEPLKKCDKPGNGKWQNVAREQLQRLHKECMQRLEEAGDDPSTARVSVDDWKDACEDAEMNRKRFHDIKRNAEASGMAKVVDGYVHPL